MLRRILLIFLTLTVPALNGMWCFDGPVRDAYDTYGAIIRGVQKNEKILKTPTHQLLASAPLASKSFQGFFKQSFLRIFCNKKKILQNIQDRLTVSLPFLNLYIEIFKHKDLQMEAELITKIIVAESKHPGYQSFFHGANGTIAMLFKLQEKLYAKYHGKKPIDFEFLRARDTRKTLVGITREEYIARNRILRNCEQPWRSELLSVAYAPWSTSMDVCLMNTSAFDLSRFTIEIFFKEIFAAYNLPMPHLDDAFPQISHGLFLHILIKNDTADRIIYNAHSGGRPSDHLAIPDSAQERLYGEARIILDPTVFDTPSDEVKIIRHQQLSDKEKKEIDTFCDNLIAQAEKLKAEQEKD